MLVAEYGEDVLALPETGGVGITAYGVPLLLGALVVAALALLVPRWRRRTPAGIAAAHGGAALSDNGRRAPRRGPRALRVLAATPTRARLDDGSRR